MKRHFPLSFHLVLEWDLPPHSFLVEGKEHDVPCVFQIWVRKSTNRVIEERLNPKNFKFVSLDEELLEPPDVSFRRVGVYAGKIDTDYISKSIQSHYFIRFINNKTIDENLNLLSKVKFEHGNTVGPKSISKQEIIKKIDHLLD
jgi:hypothetical protein